jgi:Tetratricopeptide repeat
MADKHIEAEQLSRAALQLLEQGKFEAAAVCMKRAAAASPASAETWCNLSIALRMARRFEEARDAIDRALALDPDRPETVESYGILLHNMGDGKAALRELNRAVELSPENAKTIWNRAVVALSNGDLRNGFADHEARRDIAELAPRRFPMPSWSGERISGRTILVHAEQGFGDTLHFARYLPLLVDKGARVFFAVQPELLRLFQNAPGLAGVMSIDGKLPLTDFHLPLLSLPLRFATTLDDMPATVPYITPPEGLRATLSRSADTRLAVGIAWAGRPTHKYDRDRSMAIEEFFALSDLPGVALYSLQTGPRAQDLASSGAGILIRDCSGALGDFADTATALTQIDLVVSVDTALVHLAGAMARKVFVLLPFVADWRWLRQRQDSPWYPTLRLFRQEKPGDWHGVMRRVRAAVTELLEPQA